MKPLPRSLLQAFALGILAVGGFAPFGAFLLTPLALAGLFGLWRRRPETAPLAGGAFGFGLFLAGVSWVHVSMHQYGGMPAPLSLLATALFAAVLALFPLFAGVLYGRLRPQGWQGQALVAAACWSLSEWTRGWFLTGFPWLATGYSQTPPSPLAGFAPLFGVYGVSLALSLAAASVAFAWGKRESLRDAGAFLMILLLLGSSLLRVEWTHPLQNAVRVSLLQGNIEQSLKWRPELVSLSLDGYLRLARDNPADIVVLPETALPLALHDLPRPYLDALLAAAKGNVVIGAIAYDQNGRPYNAAVSIGPGPQQRYAKSHLVPFGEFTPPLFKWTLDLLSVPMGDLYRGETGQRPLSLSGQRLGINICYEDVFGEEIIRALPEATILLNLSNTAWFGDSLAQPQHLQIARMRALETGRPMLRATNTGMTAAIAPDGEVTAVLPPFTQGALTVSVKGHEGLTPYARWGNWPLILACLSALGWAAWRRRSALLPQQTPA